MPPRLSKHQKKKSKQAPVKRTLPTLRSKIASRRWTFHRQHDQSKVHSLAFLDDGRLISYGSPDQVIIWPALGRKIWQDSGVECAYLTETSREILVSQGTSQFLSVGGTGIITFWDAEKKLSRIAAHTVSCRIQTACYHPKFEMLFIGGLDKRLNEYSVFGFHLPTMTQTVSPSYEASASCLVGGEDHPMLVTGATSGVIQLWNLTSMTRGKPVTPIVSFFQRANSLSTLPGRPFSLLASYDRVRLFDLNVTLSSSTSSYPSALELYSPALRVCGLNANLAVSSHSIGKFGVRIWDMRVCGKRCVQKMEDTASIRNYGLTVYNGAGYECGVIAVATQDDEIKVWI